MISWLLGFLDGLFVLLPWSARKRDRRREWSGTAEAKKTWTLSQHAYIVIFRTDDGRKKKIGMDRKEDFESYEEGRRYHKKAGQDLPEEELAPASSKPKSPLRPANSISRGR
jgi:hypothetical protein